MKLKSVYKELTNELKRITHLRDVGKLLTWDEAVNLPPNSADKRASESAALAEVIHRECTDLQIGQWLEELEDSKDLTPEEETVVRETRRKYNRAVKIPKEFVAKKAEAKSRAYHVWVKARENVDFSLFAPNLEEQLELARQEAVFVDKEMDPYDYFLDRYDPGVGAAMIEKVFAELKAELVPFVEKIVNAPVKPDTSLLKNFQVESQRLFALEVTKQLGFDYSCGRLDATVHPFCGGNPLDTRMTTRFFENSPLNSLFGAIHETGHALYQQGLPKETYGTPLSEPVGFAIHESQSRLWENQVSRSRAFWNHWEVPYREHFKEQLENIGSEDLYLIINAVKRNPIRVDSDEVTYNLHIILRFELEKMLFAGTLKVKDLPEAWNRLSQEIVGLAPKNDTEGVLQDVHWSLGFFGYFPSYCLGNMIAAQLWYTVLKAQPHLEEAIEKGNFSPLLEWLRTNVHSLGKHYSTIDLVKKVTGEEISPKALMRYLSERYLPLYFEPTSTRLPASS